MDSFGSEWVPLKRPNVLNILAMHDKCRWAMEHVSACCHLEGIREQKITLHQPHTDVPSVAIVSAPNCNWCTKREFFFPI
jgi:hypothetical protein